MRAFYHPGDSKGRLHAGECSRQSRHFQHTHKHTHTHISELCYERLNETKQLQRCKKHNTLDRQLSTNVQCQPSYLCLPFYYPLASLSFSTCLLSSPLIPYLTPSSSLCGCYGREGAAMSCHRVLPGATAPMRCHLYISLPLSPRHR